MDRTIVDKLMYIPNCDKNSVDQNHRLKKFAGSLDFFLN